MYPILPDKAHGREIPKASTIRMTRPDFGCYHVSRLWIVLGLLTSFGCLSSVELWDASDWDLRRIGSTVG